MLNDSKIEQTWSNWRTYVLQGFCENFWHRFLIIIEGDRLCHWASTMKQGYNIIWWCQDDIKYGGAALECDEVMLQHQQAWISSWAIHIEILIIFNVWNPQSSFEEYTRRCVSINNWSWFSQRLYEELQRLWFFLSSTSPWHIYFHNMCLCSKLEWLKMVGNSIGSLSTTHGRTLHL